MNTKTKAIALALFMLCTGSALAQMRINVTNLPNPAQTFLSRYFENAKVQRVERDFDDGQVVYEVKLSGNTEVDFDSEGNWKEVSGKVPAEIIPAQIVKSIQDDFRNLRVTKIERYNNGGYEVELSNGWDILYDQTFRVVGVDK